MDDPERQNLAEELYGRFPEIFNIGNIRFESTLRRNSTIDSELYDKITKYFATCTSKAFGLWNEESSKDFAESEVNLIDLNEAVTALLNIWPNISTSNGNEIYQAISYCAQRLSEAVNMFNTQVATFESTRSTDAEALAALKEYIDNSEIIRECDSYPNSECAILEEMLLDKQNCCKRLFPDIFNTSNAISMDFSFIALAAPSFEGKTQSAFVTTKIKPLYFSFVNVGGDTRGPQPIYRNYIMLSTTLRILAEEKDLVTLKKTYESPSNIDENISANFLSAHPNFRFWSLGFLKALAEYMNKKSLEQPERHWMDLLADDMEFQYSPISIGEIKALDFKGIYVFLDEFARNDSATFLRNLVRASKLCCVVANTNAKIANVIGTDTSSGSPGDTVWSIVFTKLDDANIDVLNSENLNLDKNIEEIRLKRHPQNLRARALATESDPVLRFLDSLRANLIRPGVAIAFAKVLRDFVMKELPNLTSDFSLGKLADFIGNNLADIFVQRKARISVTDNGKLAKIALSLTQSYKSVTAGLSTIESLSPGDFDSGIQDLCNKGNYLNDHLFYLDNPQDSDSNIFLTFCPPQDSPQVQAILDVKCGGNKTSWQFELSHFKENDHCTLIGCLFVPLLDSIERLFEISKLSLRRDPKNIVTNSSNENLASSKSGNELEVTAASILTESSRHPHEYRNNFTFKGQNGIDLVRNIIRNVSYSGFFVTITQYPKTRGFDLKNFLESCHFPFVYGSQRDGVEFFDKLSDFNQEFYVSKLTRCTNQQQVDATLPFKFGKSDRTLAIECKNCNADPNSSKLESIIKKASKQARCNLSFIFTNSFVNSSKPIKNDPANSKLTKFCSSNRINIFRLKKNTSNNFEIVPFDSKTSIFANPKHVCLIFERKIINRPIELFKLN